eukprot:gnl/Dysnectes_brevis/4387_a5876_565.p1 GENE.gnl/Dysnectes_brevis/4387_a5876_565~~gnl/Dysnectes_brevis/4387_a5876_565.p1  ORF type:complete len:545 (-),score=67.35 gnl/Dysnectes_brevis/4387_a5876_565:19-1653(-)
MNLPIYSQDDLASSRLLANRKSLHRLSIFIKLKEKYPTIMPQEGPDAIPLPPPGHDDTSAHSGITPLITKLGIVRKASQPLVHRLPKSRRTPATGHPHPIHPRPIPETPLQLQRHSILDSSNRFASFINQSTAFSGASTTHKKQQQHISLLPDHSLTPATPFVQLVDTLPDLSRYRPLGPKEELYTQRVFESRIISAAHTVFKLSDPESPHVPLRARIILTATVLMKRFFATASVHDHNPRAVGYACLLLASKVEAAPRSLGWIRVAAYVSALGVERDVLRDMEEIVVQGLGFEVSVAHPSDLLPDMAVKANYGRDSPVVSPECLNHALRLSNFGMRTDQPLVCTAAAAAAVALGESMGLGGHRTETRAQMHALAASFLPDLVTVPTSEELSLAFRTLVGFEVLPAASDLPEWQRDVCQSTELGYPPQCGMDCGPDPPLSVPFPVDLGSLSASRAKLVRCWERTIIPRLERCVNPTKQPGTLYYSLRKAQELWRKWKKDAQVGKLDRQQRKDAITAILGTDYPCGDGIMDDDDDGFLGPFPDPF